MLKLAKKLMLCEKHPHNINKAFGTTMLPANSTATTAATATTSSKAEGSASKKASRDDNPPVKKAKLNNGQAVVTEV